MALQVPCPHCGPRPSTEFTFGGDERPIQADGAQAEFARVFLPENTAGPQRERWYHALGCKTWFTVTRDRTTDRIG